MVLANTYRPPALLAKMASTLDVISKGRLELGIGAGGGGTDHRASGYAFPSTAQRVRMLDEAMVIIKGLWSGEFSDFEGRYYRLNNAHQEPSPVQQPHPPILIGGHGERHLLRVAARHADICNIGSEMTLEEHRQKLSVLEEHCREAGRDFGEIEVSHNALTLIAETRTEFDQVVSRRAAQSNVSTSTYRESLMGAIAGTPDQCAEQIQGYVDAGITYFFLIFPDPVSVDDLRLFARDVMPRFVAV
jgi:alkanesulfonate monooxygenase SsuD/methylene tetrahydromethanopterin reductase-like flavin-dependent oxidoreductase (luciferase family)